MHRDITLSRIQTQANIAGSLYPSLAKRSHWLLDSPLSPAPSRLQARSGTYTLFLTGHLLTRISNAALSIYDSVEDPKSAVVNILGTLFGVGAITKATRDAKGISTIAKTRRDMSASDVSNLGTIFKNNDAKLQSLMRGCKS